MNVSPLATYRAGCVANSGATWEGLRLGCCVGGLELTAGMRGERFHIVGWLGQPACSHIRLCRPFLSLHLIRIRSSVWSAVLWYVLLSFCSRRSGPVCTFPLFFMVWLHRRHWSAGISARVSSSIDRWKDKRSSQRLMADARRYRMPPQLGKGFGS